MTVGGGDVAVATAIGGAAIVLVVADVVAAGDSRTADAAAAALPVAAVVERLVRTAHTFGGQTHVDELEYYSVPKLFGCVCVECLRCATIWLCAAVNLKFRQSIVQTHNSGELARREQKCTYNI